MQSLTFNQQLTLMLIDKLAIGLVVVAVFYIGQRFLEAYKGRQALWTEISKERVRHIAEEWNEMNKCDCMVGDSLFEIVQIMVARDPKLASNLSSHGIPVFNRKAINRITAAAGRKIALKEGDPINLDKKRFTTYTATLRAFARVLADGVSSLPNIQMTTEPIL